MRLKIELHTHTSDDPADIIRHSPHELIDRGALLGFHALAITLHDKQFDVEPLRPYASARGILLIPGLERTIQGKHVLLINFTTRAEAVTTFEELAQLRQHEDGLVIAPHPFYPLTTCLGGILDRHPELFDAVEVNGMFTRGTDFNRAAVRWASAHGKPVVGNCDVHRLGQLGTTYSIVDAEPNADSICDAIRAGRVEVHAQPLRWSRTVVFIADIVATGLLAPIFKRKGPGSDPPAGDS